MTTMTAVSPKHEAIQLAAQIVFEYDGWTAEHVEQMYECGENTFSVGALYDACNVMQVLRGKGLAYDDAIDEAGKQADSKAEAKGNMREFIDRNGVKDKWTINHLANLVAGVRADEAVGSGSCTFIDETFTDSEILELVCMVVGEAEHGTMKKRLPSVAQAIKIARVYEVKVKELESELKY